MKLDNLLDIIRHHVEDLQRRAYQLGWEDGKQEAAINSELLNDARDEGYKEGYTDGGLDALNDVMGFVDTVEHDWRNRDA